MEIIKPAFFLLIAYLLGSIPFGVLISKIYQTDIRKVGSKSSGATNVLRTVGKKPALLTLLGDVGKGIATVLLGKIFLSSPALVAGMGLIAIIGHDWPVFAKFRGGKGVATSLGVFLILTPLPLLLTLLIWLVVLGIWRYVSLASILAGVFLPLFIWFFLGGGVLFYISLAAGILLIYRHKSNIKRLLADNENKLGKHVKKQNLRTGQFSP